ncbi:MAG TPA: hypothetical protein VHV79_10645 [Mycobacteriales bacterium]|jgi:hypothetical protein|nr:hypothetical protein [Mycobacteriales bacterium]
MRRKNDRSERRDAESAAVAALVDDIRSLRLTLAADFSAAAAAIDAAEPAVARDIMAGDRGEVRRLAAGFTKPPAAARRPGRRRAFVAAAAIPMVGVLAVTGAMALSTGRAASHDPAQRVGSYHHLAAAAGVLPEATRPPLLTTATAERKVATSARVRSARLPATAAGRDRAGGTAGPSPSGFAPTPKRPIKITGLLAVEHRLLGAWPTPSPTPTIQPPTAPSIGFSNPATRTSLGSRSPMGTGLDDTVASRTVLQTSS